MILTEPSRRLQTAILTCIPLLHVLAFECGFLCERTYPLEAGCVSLLTIMGVLLALTWGTPFPTERTWDHSTRLIIGGLCALFAWTVITQSMSPLQSGFSRVGDTAMLVSIALCVLLLRPSPRALLTLAGASVACMTLISVIVTLSHGKITLSANLAFGVGALPALGCMVTPVLTAWAISLWLRRRDEVRPRWSEYALCAAGIVALLVIIVVAERRGPAVAMAAIVCVMSCWYAWRRFPRMTIVIVVVVAALIAAYVIPRLINDSGNGRGERYFLYRVAWAVGVDGFPFGHGPLGMLAADASTSPDAMMWTAREQSTFHAHNELLNAWVEGGIVQVLLVIGLAILMALRIALCSDPVLKPAYVALGTAWLVHAMTDNTFGIPLGMAWNGVIFGAILTLPQTVSRDVCVVPRAVLWLTTACGMLAIITGWPALRMALLSESTPIHARITALESCRDPLFVLGEAWFIIVAPNAENPIKELALQMAHNRIGWTTNFPWASARVAASHGAHERLVQSLVRVVERNPFDVDACVEIVKAVRKWPELAVLVPNPIRVRCAILNGTMPTDEKSVIDGTSMQIAADLFVDVQHALLKNQIQDQHREQLLLLARHYGRIKHVAILATQVCSVSSPAYTARMMEHFDQINDGFGYAQAVPRALALAITQQQAENILPIVRATSPQWFEGLEKRQAPVFTDPNDQNERDLWQAVARIWSLTRAKN